MILYITRRVYTIELKYVSLMNLLDSIVKIVAKNLPVLDIGSFSHISDFIGVGVF